MADGSRTVIITAIVLAIIIGGSLVWLLNRTPVVVEEPQEEGGFLSGLFGGEETTPEATPTPALFTNPNLSDEEEARMDELGVDENIGKVAPAQDVAVSAPTGPQPR